MFETREPMPKRPRLGAVVIGKNEGERLGRALDAAVKAFDVTVYVDSNSSDGSRELAAQKGAVVVHLTSGPYTPSRGRQTGLLELERSHPDLDYVHFIDGDCVLQPGWVETAVEFLETHPEVGAVFGRRREEDMSRFYNRLMEVDWNHPAGVVNNFGGESLIRFRAVLDAGGWSGDTINAEDIDVSLRLREKGWIIQRLAAEMGLHDARMNHFSEYWRRSVRAGYGYLEVGLRHRHGPGRFLLRRVASSALYVAALPTCAVVGVVFWPAIPLTGALYGRAFLQMARWARERDASPSTAAGYASLNLLCKAANLSGSLRCAADLLQRRSKPRDDLIVYRRS
jgi:cellulose synthase/poly-beta-1,6-N-acetylglucosamine synthase-like glycosyltransferase